MINKTLTQMLSDEPTLFSGISLPTGIDAAKLTQIIMDRSGELFPWIQASARLKSAITTWAAIRLADWTKIYDVLTATYNPLHNYDREEVGSEEIARHKGSKRSNNYKDTYKQGNVITNVGSVVAYDSTTESETGQSVSTPSGDGDVRSGLAADNYELIQDIDANTYDRDVHSFTGRITRGNVGTTRTQDMLRDEVSVREDLNAYELIAGEFESKFLMLIY